MSILASCPSCGAALSFRPGTMVAVCAYCKALAARKDRDTALLGKVADLVDTGSPLGLGASGTYTGRSFTLAGRVQLKHPLGGVWDEWYLALDDGRWGWLAEAQGRFYLTFTQDPHGTLPSAGSLQAGGLADLGPAGLWTVGEISEATFHSTLNYCCTTPLPAVIHCTSPAPRLPRFPRLSPCSTVPARFQCAEWMTARPWSPPSAWNVPDS